MATSPPITTSGGVPVPSPVVTVIMKDGTVRDLWTEAEALAVDVENVASAYRIATHSRQTFRVERDADGKPAFYLAYMENL